MSFTLFAVLALTFGSQSADTRQAEVLVVDQRKDIAGQVEIAADKSFALLDKNGSGDLEASELSVIKVQGVRVGPDTQPKQIVSPDLSAADADRDGRVSRTEYRTWMSGWMSQLRS